LLARDLWDTSEYFRIMNKENDFMKEALRVLHDNRIYRSKLK